MTESDERTSVEIVRTFSAPPELVFDCMITPEHLVNFWGPVGMTTPIESVTIEPHVGGTFACTMVNDENGEEYPNAGIYTEIERPTSLAWEEPAFAMLNRSTFRDLGDGRTEVVIRQENVPMMFASPEAQAGFNSSLDRFEAYLTTLQS